MMPDFPYYIYIMSSVWSIVLPKKLAEESAEPMLDDIDFTQKSIIDAIKDVKNNAAPGTDRFPVVLLKECAEELSEPLYILWKHSLNNGDIAPLLKTAVICPILII